MEFALAWIIHGSRSETEQIGPDARRTRPEGRSVLEQYVGTDGPRCNEAGGPRRDGRVAGHE